MIIYSVIQLLKIYLQGTGRHLKEIMGSGCLVSKSKREELKDSSGFLGYSIILTRYYLEHFMNCQINFRVLGKNRISQKSNSSENVFQNPKNGKICNYFTIWKL